MAIDPKTHFTNIENFYKFLTPIDLYGKSKQIDQKHLVSLEKEVYEYYLLGTYSGEDIVGNIGKLSIPGKGVYFNTLFEQAGGQSTSYIDDQYFRTEDPGGNYSAPLSFYNQVCLNTDANPSSSPPRDFTINLMRTAYLGMEKSKGNSILPFGVRNCDAVEFFLNYMPSIFPSRMVPYFEVEFDFPKALPGTSPQPDVNFLNRPSLLRFLLGSADLRTIPLSAADRSLVYSKKVLTRGNKLEEAYNTGMEIFTSPQTLVNMYGLQAAVNPRIVDAKPFLPPASLTGGSINLMNAGAEAFVHMKGQVQFIIHDKARISEFSEFFRVAQGTQDLTVWMTYGWIAPRNDVENDAYSRFINQTMLKKVAFNIMNASFSIDAAGQASMTIDLVQQGKSFVDSTQLTSNDGSEFFQAIDSIQKATEDLEKSKTDIGDFDPAFQGFKIVADVKSGLDSFGPKSLSDEEKKKLQALTAEVSSDQRQVLSPKVKDALLSGLQAAQVLSDYYDKQTNKLRAIARSYVSSKFADCIKIASVDPFLPDRVKQTVTLSESNGAVDYLLYKDSLLLEIEKMNKSPKNIQKSNKKTGASQSAGTKRIVSFGKIFSSFCLPPLLKMGKDQGIDEIQVNFYQLNESCGPLSLQNIAEIPVDMDLMIEQFAASAEKSGGELMTLRTFIKTFNMSYLQDNRAIGYGLTDLYEGFTIEKPEEKSRSDKGFDFEKKRKEWSDTYGILRVPNLQIKLETHPKRTSGSYIDLLEQVRNPGAESTGSVMKIHIYDASMNPYDHAKLTIMRNSQGAYLGAPQEMITPELKNTTYDNASASGEIGGVKVIAKDLSKNPLAELVQNTLPTLVVGANGSLISSISFASKTDSQLATALAVSTAKQGTAANTLAPNGLRAAANSLPLRVTNASVSMTSLGCPIADLYQHFFIDFGTGTTLDNIYAASGINHSFGSGKFETSWTLIPVDGYSRFVGAKPIAQTVDEIYRDKPESEKPK